MSGLLFNSLYLMNWLTGQLGREHEVTTVSLDHSGCLIARREQVCIGGDIHEITGELNDTKTICSLGQSYEVYSNIILAATHVFCQ